jgi:hypothetical protein
MTDQPTNRGGRPAVGPAISVAYPETLLAEIDAVANTQRTTRAQWLREAAVAALPHDTLKNKDGIQDTLEDLDSWLVQARDTALDVEYPREEREFRAEAYASCVHEMRTLLGQIRDALPAQEARDAYAQADDSEPEGSKELARTWGRTTAVDAMESLLDSFAMMLPVDGNSVRERASLDDPHENLD